jgi:hypothetical protein
MSRFNNNSVLLNLLHAMGNKESQYKEEIKRNHGFCKATAVRLSPDGGGMEETLRMLANQDDAIVTDAQVQEFLQEQRGRLKQLAKENVQDERTVDSFLAALSTLQEQIQTGAGAAAATEDEDHIEDYTSIIQKLMQQNQAERQSTMLPMEQETYYREVCNEMGETMASANNNNDDDDEIQVMRPSGSQANSLKCPLTSMLLEEPVKSKNCGHTYSKQAILNHLRVRKQCPVAGCNNHTLNESQLEPDQEKEMQVRRERKRQEREAQLRASQANVVHSDEEEF